METIYLLWEASRSNRPLPSAGELAVQSADDPKLAADIRTTFEQVIDSDIPVAENLDFIFLLENIPISLREQIVRHRVGHHFGENFGVDTIPGEGRSSWWSQSMRILDMGSFAADGNYYVPDAIDDTALIREGATIEEISTPGGGGATTRRGLYDATMGAIASLYQTLIHSGVAPEDARQIIPLAACSRISWKLNYMSLKHVLGRRGCWIAQLGMWLPIITDMTEELSAISPVFRKLSMPPCLGRRGEFQDCPFVKDNLQRLCGQDPEPPCPAFLMHHKEDALLAVPKKDLVMHPNGDGTWDATDPKLRKKYADMRAAFGKLWGRSAYLTGDGK